MAEDEGKQEEKFEFTTEGEALGYISLDQARLRAIQHARENTDIYGPRYSQVDLVWEVLSSEEGEDYYQVRLSYRPARGFKGDPGVEQFTIDKSGSIELRQILSEPRPRTRMVPVLALVGGIGVTAAVVGTLFGLGVFSGDGAEAGLPEVPAKELVAVIDAPAEVTRSTGIRSFRLQGLSQDAATVPTVTKLTPDMLKAPPIAETSQRSIHSYLDISLPVDLAQQVTEIGVTFEVERTWLNEKKVIRDEAIELWRYAGEWERLPTEVLGDRGPFVE
ncbi:MAG: PGF-pre-PGF domain-containing protein, partial [Chloroflexi bacterium]|nr:PGF-pre-PGF domain-containing protein [Chloroflexota bacterium]